MRFLGLPGYLPIWADLLIIFTGYPSHFTAFIFTKAPFSDTAPWSPISRDDARRYEFYLYFSSIYSTPLLPTRHLFTYRCKISERRTSYFQATFSTKRYDDIFCLESRRHYYHLHIHDAILHLRAYLIITAN